MGSQEHIEALPSTPISVHHLCCVSWKEKNRSELRSGDGKNFHSCNAQLLRYNFLKIILLILQRIHLSRNCGQVLKQAQSPLLAFLASTILFLSSRAGQIILIQNTFERLFFLI